MKKILILAILIIFSSNLYAQVRIHPLAVFFDRKTNTGSLRVWNPSDRPREVTFEFHWGYNAYNEEGMPYIKMDSSSFKDQYDLGPYLKVFPKKLILPPGGEQNVKFLVRGISDKPDGTYWTRTVIKSEPLSKQLDTAGQGVSAKVEIITQMVALLVYQKGDVRNGIDFSVDHIDKDSEFVNIYIKNERTGNSPFWGRMWIEYYNDKGEIHFKDVRNLALYFNSTMNLRYPKMVFPEGTYTAKIKVDNEREEVPEPNRVPFDAEEKELILNVPAN